MRIPPAFQVAARLVRMSEVPTRPSLLSCRLQSTIHGSDWDHRWRCQRRNGVDWNRFCCRTSSGLRITDGAVFSWSPLQVQRADVVVAQLTVPTGGRTADLFLWM